MSMSTSPQEHGEDPFTKLEHKNWQRGVDAYAKGFGPLTSQAVPTLLDNAGFLSGESCALLDVACGPGQVIDTAISKASSTTGGTACTYTALDFSSNFLDLAKGNLGAKYPDTPVTFVEGDAQNMPFSGDDNGTNSFDAVTSNFGILHLSDPDAFLTESYRVLRPGGKLAFSAWSNPPATEGFAMVLGAVNDCGNANVPLPDGPAFFRFADPDEIRRSLETVGFVDIEVTVVESMKWTNVGSSDDLYKIFLEGTARTRELLKGQTKEETAAIRTNLKRRFDQHNSDGSRPLRMPAVISSGRKPGLPASK